MIEINLLPEEFKKKQERFKKLDLSNLSLKNIPILTLVSGFFGALIILQILLFFIGIYSNAVLISLDKRYNELSPKKKEAISLKAQVETINKKMNAIDELMVKSFSWAKKLNDLGDSITSGIWLTELSYNEKLTDRAVSVAMKNSKSKDKIEPSKPGIEKAMLRYLIISGFACSTTGEEGTALIGKFIKSLKDNSSFYSDFSDIELGAIKRDKFDDQEVMSFKITCLFKEIKK